MTKLHINHHETVEVELNTSKKHFSACPSIVGVTAIDDGSRNCPAQDLATDLCHQYTRVPLWHCATMSGNIVCTHYRLIKDCLDDSRLTYLYIQEINITCHMTHLQTLWSTRNYLELLPQCFNRLPPNNKISNHPGFSVWTSIKRRCSATYPVQLSKFNLCKTSEAQTAAKL